MPRNSFLFFLLIFYMLLLHLVYCDDENDDILIYDDYEDEDEEDIEEVPVKQEEEQYDDKTNEGGWSDIQRTWVGNNEKLFYTKLCSFIIAFLVAVINGYLGRKKNKIIAANWFQCCQDIFAGNFAKLGNQKFFLLEKSYDNFEFFGTGRKNCNYYLVNLNLMVRQCVWRYYFFDYFTEQKDTMNIQIHFSKLDEAVLCIYRKNKKKKVDKNFPNLTKYTKYIERKELKNIYDIRADSSEIVDLVLGGKILQFLNTYDHYINYICITDISLIDEETDQESYNKNNNSNSNNSDDDANYKKEKTEEKETYLCYLDFVIPQNNEDLRKLISFSIFMIDACHCIELSDRVKEHVKKLRALVENEDEKRKQEVREMEEKKKAKMLQQKKEKIENMTAEQQRKYEERKQKKSLKKNRKLKIIKM